MRCPRTRACWRCLVLLAIGLTPPLLWMGFLLIIPTDWARARIERAVSQSTGRTVRIEALRIGPLGGVRLTNLEIGAPGSARDPWLQIAHARVNITLLQLLFGKAEPTEARVEGLTLRILRRSDGSLELADLLPSPTAHPNEANDSGERECALGGLAIRVRNARITVIDEPNRTRLEFRDVNGHMTWRHRKATVEELRGTLNGGPFDLTAHLDTSTGLASFEGEIRAWCVELSDGMNALGYLVPVVAGTAENPGETIDGRLDLELYVRGEGLTRSAIHDTLVGHGVASLDPIRLDGSKVLAGLTNLVDLPSQGQVGSVKTDFTIKKGRIHSDKLTVNLAKVPIVLSGWTGFDGRLDYRINLERLTDRLPTRARNILSELAIDPDEIRTLKVQGTLDTLAVTMDGLPLTPLASGGSDPRVRPIDDKKRLRELGAKLRDRILR